jgi:hypothetical protein
MIKNVPGARQQVFIKIKEFLATYVEVCISLSSLVGEGHF